MNTTIAQKFKITVVSILSALALAGCAGSTNHLKSEESTFRPTISSLQKALPRGIDLKVTARSKGWDNSEYFVIEKVEAVREGSLNSRTCYTIISKNDVCENGVSNFRPLPGREYEVVVSLRNYNQLMSSSYNEKTGKWYRSSGFTRASWAFWNNHKEALIELASASASYSSLVNKVQNSNPDYKSLSKAELPLKLNNLYSLVELVSIVKGATNEEYIDSEFASLLTLKTQEKAEAEKLAIARKKEKEKRAIEREARLRKERRQAAELAKLEKRERAKELLLLGEPETIGRKVCRNGTLKFQARRRLSIDPYNGGPIQNYKADGQLIGFIEGASPDKERLQIRLSGYAFKEHGISATNIPMMGGIQANSGTLTWDTKKNWFFCSAG